MTTTPSSPKLAEPLKVVAWLTSWPKDRVRPTGVIVNRSEPQPKLDCNQYDPLVRLSDAQASIQALEADAERYRWLRNRIPGSAYRIAGVIYSEGGQGVDAAIDAARAAQEVKP